MSDNRVPEREPQTLEDVILPALKAQERGEGLVVAVLVADRTGEDLPVGHRLSVWEDGRVAGTIDPRLDDRLAADARQFLAANRSGVRSYTLTPDGAEATGMQGGNLDVFFETLHRPPRLIIVGAGHIAAPLAAAARLLDFEIIVVDDRPEYANAERFPTANRIVVGPYRETVAALPIHSDTYIVLVTRGHVHDQACLEETLGSEAAYIGMIGSKRRVRTVLEHARDRGFDPDKLRRLHAPIGLDIGSETPAEIALAILAEIINQRRGGQAPSLMLGERSRV